MTQSQIKVHALLNQQSFKAESFKHLEDVVSKKTRHIAYFMNNMIHVNDMKFVVRYNERLDEYFLSHTQTIHVKRS